MGDILWAILGGVNT